MRTGWIWTIFTRLVPSDSPTLVSLHLESAVQSCGLLLAQEHWVFENDSYYGAICNYVPALGSWLLCIKENDYFISGPQTSSVYTDTVAHLMNKICAFSIPVPPLFDLQQLEGIALNASVYSVPALDERPRNVPVLLNPDLRITNLKAVDVYITNVATSNKACLFLFVYFGVIAITAFLLRVPGLRRRIMRIPWVSRVRGHLVVPTVNEKHAEESSLGGLTPTRFELLLTLGYLVVHCLALSVGFTTDEASLFEPTHLQYLKFVSDRAAILSFAQLPLIFVFCGRNQILESIAGMKYTTSIVLHKWIGRVLVADALFHGLLYGFRAKLNGTLEGSSRQQYWVYGIYACWIGLLLCVHSVGILRRKYYEVFLVLHFAVSTLYLWLAYVHVRSFGWTSWLLSAGALMILEKMLRLARIVRLGGIVVAQADVLGDDSIVRLRIPKPQNVKFEPGHYVFLYFLIHPIYLQSHPFTVVEISDGELLVVIKVKAGATKSVCHYLRSHAKTTINICLEGPYGSSSPIEDFPHQLLLSGGSGIPGPLAYALKGLPNTALIIVSRDWSFIRAFMPQIQAASLVSSVRVFITGDMPGVERDLEGVCELKVFHMRPDLEVIVEDHAHKGPLAVISCGPPKFVDQARDIVANRLREHPDMPLAYFEEYQTW